MIAMDISDGNPSSNERTPLRVLLVEDNPGDALLARRELERDPTGQFVVDEATSLHSTLEHLAKLSPDVILVDLELSDSSGLGTLRAIRAASSASIVVLTGYDDVAAGIAAIESGASDYVVKGIELPRLRSAVSFALARAQTSKELRSMVESNSDAMVVVDHESVVQFVNPAAESLFGRVASELVGDVFGFQVTSSAVAEVEVLRQGEVIVAEIRTTDFWWSGRPAYLTSIRDITDRKRAEQYEKRLLHADRLAAIGQLAAGVAHEINNPATFVASNLRMAQEVLARTPQQVKATVDNDSEWQELQHMLTDGITGIERIAKIVEDLQSFARVDQGDVEWVDLNDVARESRAITANDLRHRAKVIESYGELPRIVADRRRLSQVVVNLLINAGHAIDARPQDDARITLRTSVRNDQLVLSVEDTGSGIASQNISRVFEPFFTTKSRGVGTGLGLSLSAETARNHGGELRVASELHVGTCFDLVLPKKTPFEPPPSTPASEARPKIDDVSSKPRRARILLIDDEAMVRRALTRVLREHEVVSCDNVVGALNVLNKDEDFDLVICDLMMPEVGGEVLYEALLERGSELVQRFVVISGGAFTPRTVAFAEAKRPTLIKKPIDHERLRHVVAHFAGARSR